MNKHGRKTKPELWEQIEQLKQKLLYMERFLDEKGLYEEAHEYITKCILDKEELPLYSGASAEATVNIGSGKEQSVIAFKENPTIKLVYNDDLTVDYAAVRLTSRWWKHNRIIEVFQIREG